MKRVIIATLAILVLDGIWLGLLATKLYVSELGPLLRLSNGVMRPMWAPAVIVYIALVSGILLFVVPKANGQPLQALLWGGLFGLVTYATYDFTNMATLANWSWTMSFIDTLWGMVLCGLTSFVTVWFTR